MIRGPIRAWDRFWFAPISARPLGAFRVAYGVLAICNLGLLMAADTDYWLTDAGLLRGAESRALAGPLCPSPLHWVQDPTTVRLVLVGTLAAAVGLTLGWRTRAASVLYYLGLLAIHHRNVATASGADVLLMSLAFCLMLSPCGAAYSLDARRAARSRGGTPADPLIIPWAQRLIQIQIAGLYLVTALLKVNGATWLDGTALHYVLCNREVGRFDLSALAGYPVLVNLLTYGGLAVELSLAVFLWSRPARRWVIPAGLGLHLGIFFLVNIPIFGELASAGYLVFLGSAEWEAIRARFHPVGWARRAFLPAPGSAYRLPTSGPLVAGSEVSGAAPGSA